MPNMLPYYQDSTSQRSGSGKSSCRVDEDADPFAFSDCLGGESETHCDNGGDKQGGTPRR